MTVNSTYTAEGERVWRVTDEQRSYAIAYRNFSKEVMLLTKMLKRAKKNREAILIKLRDALPVGYKDYAPEFAQQIWDDAKAHTLEEPQAA